MKKILFLSLLLSGCTIVPAKQIAVARECEKSGGIVETTYNPLKPWAMGYKCVTKEELGK